LQDLFEGAEAPLLPVGLLLALDRIVDPLAF